MGGCGAGACLAASCLDDEDRFVAGVDAVHEGAAVADTFDVEANDSGVWVIGEVGDEVGVVDVEFVADADDFGEAHVFVVGEVDHAHGECAALADEAEVAFAWHAEDEAGVEAGAGVFVAHGVGAEDAGVAAFDDVFELVFFLVVADFAEAAADDDGPFDFFVDAVCEDLGDDGGGDADDNEVDGAGEVADGFVAFHAEDFVLVGIDGVEGAFVVADEDVFEGGVPDFGWVFAGADDGDGAGLEEGGEVLVHGLSP